MAARLNTLSGMSNDVHCWIDKKSFYKNAQMLQNQYTTYNIILIRLSINEHFTEYIIVQAIALKCSQNLILM